MDSAPRPERTITNESKGLDPGRRPHTYPRHSMGLPYMPISWGGCWGASMGRHIWQSHGSCLSVHHLHSEFLTCFDRQNRSNLPDCGEQGWGDRTPAYTRAVTKLKTRRLAKPKSRCFGQQVNSSSAHAATCYKD